MNKLISLNSIIEMLKSSPSSINKIFIQKDKSHKKINEIIKIAKINNVPVIFVPRVKLDKESREHQGAIALISPKNYSSLEDVLCVDHPPFLLILDGIEDPRNLGSIIRTAEAAGVDGIIIPERRSVGLTEIVFHTSAGALANMKVARVKNIARLIDDLKEKGLWIIGAEASGKEYWYEFDYTLPIALVFGSEGKGLRRLIKEKCDKILSIPLFGKVNSLNVSIAVSIFLYEIVKQRKLNLQDKNE
ncbi:23S rRNA (guanosine(2251)-2'-O)-methyltransferase RlmB [Candidatus Aminicenantes bacterium AC-335-K20]|jgi:23S rRNA (guanosine2251-2'-O)-methyltransferase|nr:23S rRNA (guanosine(2251)-2'-O)-methyltransferase RlmB [SCandidatus Aminicenantes bacterium Aminicenantia_JdfR_composite]MCP2596725.1 23S rRNA (guanosine(2251)-2'-O)-methyltransferase RlmB [Candidatus Aminicenantes bacterium AC-335-G13]MCP2605973.1 23S rRNA (guanosine(2251)-2'-O)-methyltransferase RlmB [Candidatus Aminicenantes bacterium AC-708-I09]MCP2618515.1 23S rRNA (guanosine(2251)-2'-O)-methyltransferase RlmB [Candidatus Aminicenantes bacterium AC-335-A11]MCP2619281.1 23S rRNA (guanosi